MTDQIRLSMADAHARAVAVLRDAGTAAAAASSTAQALVVAEADGHGGHGLVRLATYAAQVRAGKVDGFATPALTQTGNATATVDAGHGFAYPALDIAVDWLVSTVPAQGIAAAGIIRSGHCGALSLTVERLARRGMAAVMVANIRPKQARSLTIAAHHRAPDNFSLRYLQDLVAGGSITLQISLTVWHQKMELGCRACCVLNGADTPKSTESSWTRFGSK